MKQTINHQNPNFEQLPMQINVKKIGRAHV